jgi:hypothetical protein
LPADAVGPAPTVDVLDVLAQAACTEWAGNDQHVLEKEGPDRDWWRRIAQAVRTAAEPFQYPTSEAYEAACKALERHRERATIEHARSYQLALLVEGLLALLAKAWETQHALDGTPPRESEQEVLDSYREQLDEACCTGEHAADQPHIDFREALRESR